MNLKLTKESLIQELEKLKKAISGYNDLSNIPDIEKDIILSHIRDIYDFISSLQVNYKAGIQQTQPKIQPDLSIKRKIIAEKEEESMELIEDAPDETETVRPVKPTSVKTEDSSAPGKNTDEKKKSGPEIIADKFKGSKQNIYDSLYEKSAKPDVSSKLQTKPIKSIASAIGVNDKFKLIRELFKGDKESYNKTIEVLNNSANFNEAFTYISTNFNWDMEDDSVQYILDLVRRKFISDKND